VTESILEALRDRCVAAPVTIREKEGVDAR
jgi:hypothetical protein